MTKLLDKAIAEVRKLPPSRQDRLATLILDEIGAEPRHRPAKGGRAPSRLDELVAEADREIDSGKTFPLEFSRRR